MIKQQSIYLDYNATAPMHPRAISALQLWLGVPANPSSVHSFGRAAKKGLEDARKTIAEAISAWANEVIFTSSGTEANNMALLGFPERRLLVSAVEHSSVLGTLDLELGIRELGIRVKENGVIDLSDLEKKLASDPRPALVSVMLANNETGVIQPIAEVAEICKKYGALLHCDAVQALGKISLDFSLLGTDMMTISAHKCGGGVGAAALIVKNNLAIKPLIIGGGQELGRRAGTENIAAIAAFAAAVENIDLAQMKNLRGWLDDMENKMKSAGGIIIGADADRLPNTSCVAMRGASNEVQLMNFDLAGFAVSAGSACSSGRVEVSKTLLAMGIPKETAVSSIRISGGWNSKESEIQAFTQNWLKLAARLGCQ